MKEIAHGPIRLSPALVGNRMVTRAQLAGVGAETTRRAMPVLARVAACGAPPFHDFTLARMTSELRHRRPSGRCRRRLAPQAWRSLAHSPLVTPPLITAASVAPVDERVAVEASALALVAVERARFSAAPSPRGLGEIDGLSLAMPSLVDARGSGRPPGRARRGRPPRQRKGTLDYGSAKSLFYPSR